MSDTIKQYQECWHLHWQKLDPANPKYERLFTCNDCGVVFGFPAETKVEDIEWLFQQHKEGNTRQLLARTLTQKTLKPKKTTAARTTE